MLLSFSGLKLWEFGSGIITPFYIWGTIIILTSFFRTKGISKFQKDILLIILFLSVYYIFFSGKQTTYYHYIFYLLSSYSILYLKYDTFSFLRIHKTLIILSFINIVIAYILYLLKINSPWLLYIFQRQDYQTAMRFPGFTTEPSYMAIMMTISILIIINLGKFTKNKKTYSFLILYIVTLLLAKTTYGFICISIVLLYYYWEKIKKITTGKKIVFFSMLFIIILFIPSVLSNNEYYMRLEKIYTIIPLLNTDLNNFLVRLNDIDSSAYMRVGPFFEYLNTIDLCSYNFWFGHGLGENREFFSNLLFSKEENFTVNLGFFPAFIYDVGIVFFTFTLYLIIRNIKNIPLAFMLIFIISLPNCNIPTQLFWFIVLNIYITDYCNNNSININERKYIYQQRYQLNKLK